MEKANLKTNSFSQVVGYINVFPKATIKKISLKETEIHSYFNVYSIMKSPKIYTYKCCDFSQFPIWFRKLKLTKSH